MLTVAQRHKRTVALKQGNLKNQLQHLLRCSDENELRRCRCWIHYVDRMTEEYGGMPELAKQVCSLYPDSFSKHKDQEIAIRLIQSEREG